MCLLNGVGAFGQGSGQAQQVPGSTPLPLPPATDTVAPNIPGVVAGGTKVQVVKEGFKSTDGPIGLPDGSLLFWDFLGSQIVKIDNNGNLSTFLTRGSGVGRTIAQALALDSKGRLISVDKDKTSARIAVVYPPGSEQVLAESFEGKPISDPNDLVVDKKGGVYYTLAAEREVQYVRPDGTVIRVLSEKVEEPNGLQLSPDEKILYVSEHGRVARVDHANLDTEGGEYILAFDIQPDGTVRNRRHFAKYEPPRRRPEGSLIRAGGDGLAIDGEGRVYAATPWEFRSSARRVSTSASFRYRGIPRTWPLPGLTRRCCTSVPVVPSTRSRC